MSSTPKNTTAADKKSRKAKKTDEPEQAAPTKAAPAKAEPQTASEIKDASKKMKKQTKPKMDVEEPSDATTSSTDTKSGGASSSPDNLEDRFDNLLKNLDEQRQHIKDSINEVRDMRKQFRRKMREMNKKKRRDHKGGNANKSPSGFAQPCKISDELCKFLGVPSGELVPRTHVTKEIINYIKTHDLQNPENRKKIEPDETLRRLVGDVNDLTFFNLQVHLNPHFPRKEKKVAAAAAAPASA